MEDWDMTLVELFWTLRGLAQSVPTAEDLERVRVDLEEQYRAEGRKDPERAEFWDKAATSLGRLLVSFWEDAHESPAGDLEANGGAVAESGEPTTTEV